MRFFLSENWIQNKIAESREARSPHQIAALMHIYFGTLSLKDISKISGLSLDTLKDLRTKGSFTRLVDNFKKEYSREFREALLINDYSVEEYETLAADFTILDEMLQIQIKVPLFTQLRKLSQNLKSKKTFGLKIENYDLKLFKRLLTFFMFVERYNQTLTTRELSEIEQVAKNVLSTFNNIDKEIDRILNDPISKRDRRLKELMSRLDNLIAK